MNKPHKHAELIKAWADGAEIEYRYYMHTCSKGEIYSEWIKDKSPDWFTSDDYEYRIKPEPKPDVVMYYRKDFVEDNLFKLGRQRTGFNVIDNLKLTFDGETGELKSAEVLK